MDVASFLFRDLFAALLNLGDRVGTFFIMSLRDVITERLGFELPDWLLQFEFLDYTVFSFMIGSGIFIFLVYTLVKWILDIAL